MKEGQQVSAGDVLFEIDPVPFQLAVAQAQRQARAMPRPATTTSSPTSSSMARCSSSPTPASTLKQRDVDRKISAGQEQFRLAARPRQFLDRAGHRAGPAAIRQAAALHRAQPAARQPRPAARGISGLRAGQGRARRRPAQPRPHRVRAPMAGVATQVDQIQLGRFVVAGTPVFSIIDVANPWVDANPKESDFTYVEVGQPVIDRRRCLPRSRLQGHRRLALARHRRAIRDPAAAERHRQFRQGGAARAGADLFRQERQVCAEAEGRHERLYHDRYRPSPLARRAASASRRRKPRRTSPT